MSLLTPFGLFGLLSIVMLIVIYIIKPNYQHKEVTSTYIWKLSLKYRKKRLPTSKLRNILLIICQVLALVAGILIMAQPIIRDNSKVFETEVIAIIDASASMRTQQFGVTRFERAVEEATDLVNNTIDRGGYASVILSNGNDSYLVQKAGLSARSEVNAKLAALVADKDNIVCSYAAAKLDNAITLCEDVVKKNPSASVYLYTDTNYAYVPQDMTLVNVASESEWNVGILNAYTEFEEGYYTFFVEIGCYGNVSRNVRLNVSINGANDDRDTVEYSHNITIGDNSEKTIIFRNSAIKEADYDDSVADSVEIVPVGADVIGQYNRTCVFAYDDVFVSIDEDDCLAEDNSFSIFGGRKQQLKIQYATTDRKVFITSMFGVLRKLYTNSWELDVDIVDVPREDPATMGYDLYLYEGYTPTVLPLDGVVFLWNPSTMPIGLTKLDERIYNNEMYFVQESDHAIIQYVEANKIFVKKCTRLLNYDANMYRALWSVDGNPVLLLNDGDHEKVIVALFDISWSNVTLRNDFAYFLYNIFETYLPATVNGRAFEVGQNIQVRSRGTRLTVSLSSADERTITALPTYIQLDTPGVYTFTQENYFKKQLPAEDIFVKLPSSESNIFATGIMLKEIYRERQNEDDYQDLLVYLAAAMLALLFAEWFLQTQESM